MILSSLCNRAFVLLNYRSGDTAVVTEERCACGRSLPRLLNLEGRVANVLRLPGGRTGLVYHVVQSLTCRPQIRRFQIVRRTFEVFDVFLVLEKRVDDNVERREVRQIVEAASGPGIQVHVEIVSQIGQTPAGKASSFVSLLHEGG